MRETLAPLVDGVATGVALSAVAAAVCRAVSGQGPSCGGWILVLGAFVAIASAFWSLGGRSSPPGLLGQLGLKGQSTKKADGTRGEGSIWLDRFVSPRNVWLVAGLTMIVLSFLPPFLR